MELKPTSKIAKKLVLGLVLGSGLGLEVGIQLAPHSLECAVEFMKCTMQFIHRTDSQNVPNIIICTVQIMCTVPVVIPHDFLHRTQ